MVLNSEIARKGFDNYSMIENKLHLETDTKIILKGFINASNNTPLTSNERDNDNVNKVSKNENEMNIEDMSEEKLA